MTKRYSILIFLFLIIIASCSDQPKQAPAETTQNAKTVSERADSLLALMTLEEKISQLRYDSPPIERLNIPAYNWWNEALHGVARSAKATVFPQTIGLAATFDPELMQRVGDAISTESRAIYNEMVRKEKPFKQYMGLTYWSPNVNIFRDPRWGRGQETFGEDPLLSGEMGAAFIRGMQGDDPDRLKVATCAKHFAVHSGPEGERHGFNAKTSKKEMAEFYLPAFKMCVDAGTEAVMCAYNRTNDEPCCGSPYLLQEVLRNEWGFQGHVVSDCGAIMDFQWGHHVTDSITQSIALALKSGVNLNCGQAYQQISKAIEQGLVDEELIDERLKPLLLTRFKLGFFDPVEVSPFSDISVEIINSEKHRQLAYETAQKSAVLLQNKNNVLPLSKDLNFVYMVGPLGSNEVSLVGNYNGLSPNMVTLVEGVTRAVSATTRIEYRPGVLLNAPNSNPIDWYSVQSREADATICMVGFSSQLEGEEGEAIASATHGDNPTMQLPASQIDLIKRLSNDERPVVLVVNSGSPVDLSQVKDLVDAIIYAWYPGEAGGLALADLIFGEFSPSGKLPITFPKSVDQLPAFNDYSLKGRTYRYMNEEPLYPFGFGLSYTSFELSQADIEVQEDEIIIKTNVSNSGSFDGEEVIQVYLSLEEAPVDVPIYEIKSFKRIAVPAGETLNVTFSLAKEHIVYYDTNGESKVYSGKLKIHVGNVSPGNSSVQQSTIISSTEIII